VPIDPHAFDEADLERSEAEASERHFHEFDCPVCSANNPYDEGFVEGDEVRCFYCGEEFKVTLTTSGRLKLREI